MKCAIIASALWLVGAQLSAQARKPLAFVSNEVSRSVSVVDLTTRKVIATIPLGERPRGIHVSPDGKQLLVALSDDQPQAQSGRDAIAAIDVGTFKVAKRWPGGTDPEQFTILPKGNELYATNEDAGTTSALDLRTGKVVASLVVGIEPEGVAVSPDGRWVYVTA